MRSWSFAAATPACVRDRRSASLHRRSSYRARPVPAEVSPLHASSARFRAPGAPVLPVALGEAGDAMPSNLYTARFFSQHPGPNVRFLKISATRLLQGLNCYELSWGSVGVHKAEATAEALSLVATDVAVDVRVHRLAGQESSMASASVLKAVASADLIIDATANADVFTVLASVARINRRPICWAEVFAGGIGGLIARARPDTDPNPLAVRDGINRYYEQLPPAPYMNATGYDINTAVPIIADDAAVSHVASALARLALDTALQQIPSAFPHTAYLVGLQPEWIFSGAFDTRPIDVTGPDWSQPASTDEDRGAAVSVLLKILNEGTDDPADTAAEGPPDHRSSAA